MTTDSRAAAMTPRQRSTPMMKILPIILILAIMTGYVQAREVEVDILLEREAAEAPRIVFTEEDRELILEFYEGHRFPPELADPEFIDPDLERRLTRSLQLPPGLAARPLPHELERQLSHLPPGYVRFLVGSDAVLMDVRLWEVRDIIENVLRAE
jgi:hypothetical protein